jgi:anti-anti-sigma regulatory factor
MVYPGREGVGPRRALPLSPASDHWRLEWAVAGEATLVRFAGHKVRLSEQHLRLLGGRLPRLVQESGRRSVLLDLCNVECVASTALGQFVRLHRELAAAGGRLSPHVAEVLAVSGLDAVLDVCGPDGTDLAAPA